jgi:competence protein CoiA
MQIFALDEKNSLIAAHQALRQQDYHCVECKSLLRLRGGSQRQLHFYHFHTKQHCGLSKKSLTHLQIQFYIQKKLNLPDTSLEYRFPHIQRIADVFWSEKNIVFEIQCSKIPIQTLLSRTQDYRSIGINVVWIFHDHCFSKSHIARMEEVIREIPHYFTNLNSKGSGIIYDQFLYSTNDLLKKYLPQLEIDLSVPKKTPENFNPTLAELIPRLQFWKIHFKQDLLDQFLYSTFSKTVQPVTSKKTAKLFFIKKLYFWLKFVFDHWIMTHCSK